jgi:hypothetical protein
MDAQLHSPVKTSPLLLGTAVGIIVLCAMVLGSVTGVIPLPGSHRAIGYQPLALPVAPASPGQSACANCGTVVMIRTYEVRGDLSPFDAPAGAAPGAIVMGEAKRKVVAALEPAESLGDAARKRQVYRVTLQMEDGSYRTVSQATEPEFRPGDKARLVQGAVVQATTVTVK